MKALRNILLALWVLVTSAPSVAAETVRVENGWTRATLPGQKVAGIYLEILSPTDARVTAVSFPKARSTELHSMKLEGGTMKMRAMDSLELPAGKRVKLEPGGLHIMAFDLQEPLRAGQKLPLVLTIEIAGQAREVHANVEVVENKASGGQEHHHH